MLPSRPRADLRQRSSAPFSILAVCSGNICRSPQLAALLEDRLPKAFGVAVLPQVEVASAGTIAVDGSPMDPLAALELERLGIDGSAHRSCRLTAEHVANADLILGLSREHRAHGVGLEPAAVRRVFTLAEFSRILHHVVDPVEGVPRILIPPMDEDGITVFLRRVVEAAARGRGLLPPPASPDALDVVDPHRRSPQVYEESARRIALLVDRLAEDCADVAAGLA